MKKSLSLLLAIAMVFSMFAGVASAAESGLTAQQKYEALKAKGIFAGMADGSAGLDQNMTRAQFARVAALILGLEGIGNPDTKVVTEKPFPDVELDAWYVEEVAAAKEAGIMQGNADGTFNPNGNITVQELAVVTAGLLDLEAVEGAEVDGAANWAAGYIQAILDAGLSFPTNYTDAATRAQLVDVAFQADEVINPVEPAKVSVASAKPIGIQKVEVKFDKAVDTEKATLTLKRGATTLATKAEFSADKKSAVLTLTEAKIGEAEYTVTLGGIDASEIDNATAKFTAEAETVKAIEFVTASEWIAYSENATLKLAATNQYGEIASQSAGSFSAFVLGKEIQPTKDDEGYLTVKFDITDSATGLGKGLVQGSSVVPVTVYYNDNRVTATKQFKLGTKPFLSKVEVGEVKYSNGSALTAADQTATIPLKLYDQYGNPVVQAQMTGATPEVPDTTINVVITPYSQNLEFDKTKLFDANGNAQAVIKMKAKEDKNQDYTVTVYAGSSSATATVAVGAGKLATKVQFGSFEGTVAAGDTKEFYVPLIATDANGEQLSAQDIVDNAKADRFKFTGSNAKDVKVEYYGDKKGQVKFTLDSAATARSTVYLTVLVATANANSYDQISIPVQAARYPDHIVVKKEPAAKAILGAEGKFQFQLKDQYGEDLKNNYDASVTAIPDANGQEHEYQIKVSISGDTATSGIEITNGATTLNDTTKEVTYNLQQITNFNSEFKFTSDEEKYGKVTIKAVVQKKASGAASFSDYSGTISRTIEAIKPNTSLTYSIEDLGTTFAYIDKKPGASSRNYSVDQKIFERKQIKVVAKDSAGNTVALPEGLLRGITTSDATVAQVYYDSAANEAYLLGNKAGKATITAIVYTNKGETLNFTNEINVSADPIKVESITAKEKSATYSAGKTIYDLFGKLTVVDQYGKEYVEEPGAADPKDEVSKANDYLGLRFSISSVTDGKAEIDAEDGTFGTVTAKEFVVTVIAPSGKSVSIVVKNP